MKCVTFDPLVTGTEYGVTAIPPNNPGDLVFTENGISAHVFDFAWPGGGGAFNFCQVKSEAAVPGFGTGNIISINNITLEFDFSALSFEPKRAIFNFADQGGSEHIRVNDAVGTEFVGELQLISLPYNIAPEVDIISVDPVPIPGGVKGRVILVGPVQKLRVGGQEFFLDNVCAFGE